MNRPFQSPAEIQLASNANTTNTWLPPPLLMFQSPLEILAGSYNIVAASSSQKNAFQSSSEILLASNPNITRTPVASSMFQSPVEIQLASNLAWSRRKLSVCWFQSPVEIQLASNLSVVSLLLWSCRRFKLLRRFSLPLTACLRPVPV